MAGKPRSTVKADMKANRLVITLSSPVNKAELDKVYTDVRFCVADLRPGFDVITDLSQCSIGHLSGLATLRKIMSFLVANKVGRVVRIVGQMSVLLKQLLAMTARFQCYKPIYVTSQEEAETALSRPATSNLLEFKFNQRPITFVREGELGQGQLMELSLNGCVVHDPSLLPSQEEVLIVRIPLLQASDQESSFNLSGRVGAIHENGFTVQFEEMDGQQQEQLYQWLASEVKQDPVLTR